MGKMRRNCNLELGLLPSSTCLSLKTNGENPQEEEQMTIFYNGRICVCDVTELQARSIIWFASRKMEEGMSRSPIGGTDHPITATLNTPTGLSRKRSLRQFLENRQHRIQATSPYHH